MVKRKVSGQTIAIIILAVLLILTIGFGGVYAFYSAKSNKISGRILMATLNITMESGTTDKSEIVISNDENVVPGQPLENSPLIVKNKSTVNIYLVVVYRIEATKKVNESDVDIVDKHTTPVLGLGLEYVNSIFTDKSSTKDVTNSNWVDYVFKADDEDKNAQTIQIDEQNSCKGYRCLVSMIGFDPTKDNEPGITVIGQDELSLSGLMGNDYQSSTISFTFQAYAIGSATNFGFAENETKAGKCEKIVRAIYDNQDEKFLNASVTK